MTSPEKIRLLCGDSTELLLKEPDASFDVMVTDPPYGIPMWQKCEVGQEGGTRGRPGYRFDWHLDDASDATAHMNPTLQGAREKSDPAAIIRWTLEEAARLIREDGYVYMTLGDNVYADAVVHARKVGFKVKTWAWVKTNPTIPFPNSAYRNNVEMVLFGYRRLPNSRKYLGGGMPNYLVQSAPRGKKRGHPTQKPEELSDLWLTQTPGRVLDPFMGSGSFVVSAARLGLGGLGIEKKREYFEFAKSRVIAVREAQSRQDPASP